jgi:transposase-like protein
LQGIGTRKLKSLTKDLFGAPVSAGTVSNVVSTLDADLQAYPSKPLSDGIVFLFLDGASQKVREIGVEGKGMLGAFGIHADGTKELLSFRLTEIEDTENGRGFLVDLKGQALKRIIVNGNAALLRALREIHPLRRIQRCIAHKLRNVVVKRKRAQRPSCMGKAQSIFSAPSRGEAIRRFKGWREKWFEEAESAVRCPEKDLFHCLHYYRFPEELWRTIRTTNILERAFSGSPAKDEADGRIHQCRIGRADHVRSDAEAKRQLGGTSPSGNSTKWLT